MLYPGADENDVASSKAFVSQWLAEPIRQFYSAGHSLPAEQLLRILTEGGHISDLNERLMGGLAVGDLFKTLFALAKNNPPLASWESAVRIFEECAGRLSVRGRRTDLLNYKKRFLSVAHLWAAWSIRNGKFTAHPECGYDGYADFQAFLTESEILRDFGQNWRPAREKGIPPLPSEVWQVPQDWTPLPRQIGWPATGVIPDIAIPEALLARLRPAGRPRR